MNLAKILKRTVIAATLSAAAASYAQDIKLGFNGDLSASPSAQSGKAGVIGIEAAIADINAAFGGGVNPSLSTPQGQIASSDTAIIADSYIVEINFARW